MSARFHDVESYAHVTAKRLIVEWFREAAAAAGRDAVAGFAGFSWRVNRAGPAWGIWDEYPILSDGTGAVHVWDEISDRWRARSPSYADVIEMGYRPMAVVDIAIQHKGRVILAIEIRHKSPVGPRKLSFLHKHINDVLEIPAYWVLGQVDRPCQIPGEFWL